MRLGSIFGVSADTSSGAEEASFRAAHLKSDIRQFRIFALIVLGALAVFVRSDYLASGASPVFVFLVSLKLAFGAATGLLLLRLAREDSYRRYDLLAFLWTLVYSVLVFVVDRNRPPDYTGAFLANLLNILGFYLLIPNALRLQIAAAALFTALVLLRLFLNAQHIPPLERFAVIVCFALGNLVGVVESHRIGALRREEHRIRGELGVIVGERDRLIRETNHRVKNNLVAVDSLLSLQSAELADGAARNIVEESRARLQSILYIHEILTRTQTQSLIPMGDFLRTLFQALREVYADDAAAVEIRAELAEFDADPSTASSCGMIVTELVTNAFKYAFPAGRPGTVALLSAVSDGRCAISVADDGVGLPPGFDPESAASLGLRIVSGYATQLHGSLSWETGPGARFRVEFPLRAEDRQQ